MAVSANRNPPLPERSGGFWLAAAWGVQLETDFASDLPVAGQLLRSGSSERTVGKVDVEGRKVHPVEYVEELEAEFEIHAFGDGGILVEIHVRLDKVGRTEQIGLLVALRAERRLCELAGSKGSIQERRLGSCLVITGDVGVIEAGVCNPSGIAVRVVVAAARREADSRVRGRRAGRGAGSCDLADGLE